MNAPSPNVHASSSYIDKILEENKRLKHQLTPPETGGTLGATEDDNGQPPSRIAGQQSLETVADPARTDNMDVRPWFINTSVTDTPILMAAVADSAFATRFRQVISDAQMPQHKHLPRVNYAPDRQLIALGDADIKWPGPSRSRFLVDVALKPLSRSYHIVRRSIVLDNLERSIQDLSWGDSFQRGKLWALFAVGELYSARSASDKAFPGMAYFAKALRVIGRSHERPNVEAIETRLILAFFSLALNRRYSAYWISGTSMRMAIVIGLHLHIPPSQIGDAAVCEHRKRVFWSAYIIDRMWASMLGHPPAVQDEDIDVGLPSDVVVAPELAGDFADAAYYIASLRLASVVTRTIRSIYGRRNTGKTFTARVQQALTDLRVWVEELPSHLHVDAQGFADSVPKPVSLHLSFNQVSRFASRSSNQLRTFSQCAILTTRPVLLHVLRTYIESSPVSAASDARLPASAVTLAETCIRCARHSIRLLTEAWVDGTFATFDFFYTQYLFSALLVLAVSSLLGTKESACDRDAFEDAASFLEQLKEAGNFAAHEFWHHVDATKAVLDAMHSKRSATETGHSLAQTAGAGIGEGATSQGGMTPAPYFAPEAAPTTAGMALTEPSLQQLLAQPSLDLQFLEGSVYDQYSQGLYWPDLTSDCWTSDGWPTS
ncbi:uncharacterized protein J7T54_002415 [Emericellopsis cladophorae]|uniref:Xylanolytic transcriptional activator regulatory domain-containing protein n=1 Tax=Emericellopsis cladophorae TaxID=2686198 RepID=A0A9P9Y2X4_9HYPO|nr:uncharacterized protein J7T54_002415 [Emericellopsis cladophorae]KAI6782178.1 hypothetical protein J7T54_002415 [Emericellopsis cladophorae]